jgi:RNA polymerase sigma factor (TIGR02999 family)
MANTDVSERLLQAASDAESRQQLFTLIYADLRTRASKILAAHNNPSLNTTALVHEAYLKLVNAPLPTQSKEHFFRLAAQAMRQIMVDHARYHLYQKRDQRMQVSLNDELGQADPSRLPDLIELDQALERLRSEDAQLAAIVELHFFAGLGFAEIAEMWGISLSTVERDWRTARALLYRHMQ